MNFEALIERLSKFPRAQRVVAYVSIGLVILSVYFFAIYQPTKLEEDKFKQDIAEKKSQIQFYLQEVLVLY